MTVVTLTEAQARLPELIDSLMGAEEVVITRGDEPVATLTLRGQAEPSAEVATSRSATFHSIRDLRPISVGTVLKPDFNRAEVWDEMIERRE